MTDPGVGCVGAKVSPNNRPAVGPTGQLCAEVQETRTDKDRSPQGNEKKCAWNFCIVLRNPRTSNLLCERLVTATTLCSIKKALGKDVRDAAKCQNLTIFVTCVHLAVSSR